MSEIFSFFEKLDPGPIFVISLLPYLFFLYWAAKVSSIPKVSLLGFRLTLLFVVMTIICSIFANLFYGKDLTDIDPLHGFAEAFLAISDGLIVFGFARQLDETSE